MITAKELREMNTNSYAEDAVDLYVGLTTTMDGIIKSYKYGDIKHRIFSSEYYERETAKACYVLDCLEELGYTLVKGTALAMQEGVRCYSKPYVDVYWKEEI